MNVSMVSVSRRAAPPHLGHVPRSTNSGTLFERRTACAGDLDVGPAAAPEAVFRHRHDAARRAVNHRNGRAPIALARDAPILDAVGDGRFAEAVPLRRGRSSVGALLRSPGRTKRPEFSTTPSSTNACVIARFHGERGIHRTNHRADRNAVLPAEFEIALVVRGHGHDGAGAVAHQHEVADPDGHLARRCTGLTA